MSVLRLAGFIFLFIGASLAQTTCENHGAVNGSTCACPPGFGGESCSIPTCGGTSFQGSSRPLSPVINGFGNSTGCSCSDGWIGEGCNVCSSSNACQSAWAAVFGQQGATSGTTGLIPNALECRTGVQVYSSSEMSCRVVNPTLQALYPKQATLNILRTIDPSKSPLNSVSYLGDANTVRAQLFYDGVEQFYCQANSCVQQTGPSDGSGSYTCQNLQCVCRRGTSFCGAVPATDLTATINSLSGELAIDCQAPTESGATCAFKQGVLKSLFGANGLALSNCYFGECVSQSVIDSSSNSTTTATEESNHLDGGVIAGLAVVGAFVLAAVLGIILGLYQQRKARASGKSGLGGGLTDAERKRGVGIRWKNVSYTIPIPRSRRTRQRNAAEKDDQLEDGKLILDNISGEVQPGKMMAILGPSGAGKTSLIELIGGKNKSGRASGSISFITPDESLAPKRPRVGFVDQVDILPATLTVREVLLFSARLRLPESVSEADKAARVFEVMNQLGIADLADTRIGSTQGLDSVSALKVATVLKQLASDPDYPTAVIASIHQPSSQLYQTFDDILVLAAGRTLYSGGGGHHPADYFASKGFPCPPMYNLADHLLDLASSRPPTLDGSAPTRQGSTLAPVSEKHQNVEGTANVNGHVAETTRLPNWISGTGSGHLASSHPDSEQYETTFFTMVQTLCGRELMNLKRDKSLFITHFAAAAVLGVFCGGMYFNTKVTISGFQSRVGCLFFLGSLISFSSLSALYNLVEIKPLFLRERAGSYYSPSAWLLSRFIFDLIPLRIIPTIVVATITYWMAGLSPDAARFFKFLLILVLFALAMALFNFLLASVFRNGGIAILLSALFNLYTMTFAGFFVNLNDIPPVLRWLQWLCPLKYCLEALSVNEVGSGLMIEDTLQGVPVNVSAQLIMELLFGFGANNYYRDVLVLFAFIAGFAVMLIISVWLLLRERR
ncbi:hypothetical protein FRC03_010801 [Tulasnella sp. 419]|nr:hypothetical protein FRC03_010801 [Tulasnella sp. 419]